MLLCTITCSFVFEHLFSVTLGLYAGVELGGGGVGYKHAFKSVRHLCLLTHHDALAPGTGVSPVLLAAAARRSARSTRSATHPMASAPSWRLQEGRWGLQGGGCAGPDPASLSPQACGSPCPQRHSRTPRSPRSRPSCRSPLTIALAARKPWAPRLHSAASTAPSSGSESGARGSSGPAEP